MSTKRSDLAARHRFAKAMLRGLGRFREPSGAIIIRVSGRPTRTDSETPAAETKAITIPATLSARDRNSARVRAMVNRDGYQILSAGSLRGAA